MILDRKYDKYGKKEKVSNFNNPWQPWYENVIELAKLIT